MEFSHLISQRHSVRKYRQQPVEPEKLQAILQAMRLSPSAGNRQEWKFFAVTEPSLIDAVSKATLSGFVADAPAILIACGKGDSIMRSGHDVTTVDTSIAMTIGMLAAADLGLGTCLIASHEQGPVVKALGLTEEWRIPMICTIGYPDGEPAIREKKPFSEICFLK